MKAVMVTDSFIIRETGRMVNRDADQMQIALSLEIQFGEIVSEELKRKEAEATWFFTKKESPDLWDRLKDASNDKVMSELKSAVDQYMDLVEKSKEYEKNPEMRRVVIEMKPSGEQVIYYEDEDKQAFDDAVKRLAQEPVPVARKNVFPSQIEELKVSMGLNQIEAFLDHLQEEFKVAKGTLQMVDI